MTIPQVGDKLNKRPQQQHGTHFLVYDAELRAFLGIMYATGEDAEDRYHQALEGLRSRAPEIMVALVGAYAKASESDYPHRHALVQVASALRHDAALPFLSVVVSSPFPEEQSEDTDSFSTVAEETIIRMSAVDGIAVLASKGNKEAIEALMSFLTIPSFSIRRASVMGLLDAGDGRRLRKRMRALIPEDQHFIFDLKKAYVREAAQIKDPRRHLAEHAHDYETSKPDVIRRSPKDTDGPRTR
jgi:hypothetical protein